MPNITGHIARGGFPSGEQVGFQPGHHSTAPASTQGIEIKWKWPTTRAKEMTRGKTFQQKRWQPAVAVKVLSERTKRGKVGTVRGRDGKGTKGEG